MSESGGQLSDSSLVSSDTLIATLTQCFGARAMLAREKSSNKDSYRILAFRYGTVRIKKSAAFLHYEIYAEPDSSVVMDYYFWLVTNSQRVILIDTGFSPHVGVRRGRTCLCPPLDALSAFGVSPCRFHTWFFRISITTMLATSMLSLRRRSSCRRKSSPSGPAPTLRRSQLARVVEQDEIASVARAMESGRVRLIDGDREIAPGVRVLLVGGHSPGQQMIMVEDAYPRILLATDALHFYEELEKDWPFAVCVDVEEVYKAYDLIRSLEAESRTVVVPGHDAAIGSRFHQVPAVGSAVAYDLRSPLRPSAVRTAGFIGGRRKSAERLSHGKTEKALHSAA